MTRNGLPERSERPISPRTIHKHAEGIYRNLGVTDRVAAVSTAWSALDAGR